jgi:hypothetical protein
VVFEVSKKTCNQWPNKRVHGGFLAKIDGNSNESRHSTQLNETIKTSTVLYTEVTESHGRVVNVTGFNL